MEGQAKAVHMKGPPAEKEDGHTLLNRYRGAAGTMADWPGGTENGSEAEPGKVTGNAEESWTTVKAAKTQAGPRDTAGSMASALGDIGHHARTQRTPKTRRAERKIVNAWYAGARQPYASGHMACH